MSLIPTVEHFRACPAPGEESKVDAMAERLMAEQPELARDHEFRHLVPLALTDAPTLHLDDVSEIPMIDRGMDVRFMQERARLRAGDGDLVASVLPSAEGFETYFRDQLGLGSVKWLHPTPPKEAQRVATACWEDREVRRALVHELRQGGLLYLHPHIGSFPVWELAERMHKASRRPVKVIAPPPAVAKWANDKVAFAELIGQLFGKTFIPRTMHAFNYSVLAQKVRDLSASAHTIGIKLPDSAGGGGNLVVSAELFRGRSLHHIDDQLRQLLRTIAWDKRTKLLVGTWETQVICAPSAQLWIPPESEGGPIMEGLFVQEFVGREGMFVGSKPADFSEEMSQQIVNYCWLTARVFQRLGYIGRCSFDLLLVGDSLDNCRIEFIECNGRWGGTSAPMMLMNRLFGDWRDQPFTARECEIPGLDRLRFTQLLELLRDDLYDARTGQGSVIVYNPSRLQARSGISQIVLGETWESADHHAQVDIPQKLSALLASQAVDDVSTS